MKTQKELEEYLQKNFFASHYELTAIAKDLFPKFEQLQERIKELEQKNMFKKEFNITGHDAHTLDPIYLGDNESGWSVSGDVQEDYYTWVNDFKASHPTHGKVYGNFEETVYADSEEAYLHFIENHPPTEWDYWEI